MTSQIGFAADGVSFIYINGSNNNDQKMKKWYEEGVLKLHPELRNQFYQSKLANQYFLKNGQYTIEEKPVIFFWGDDSREDLDFVDSNLALVKGVSPWVAYKVRWLVAHYLHDAIWVQKYHNMQTVLASLHKTVQQQAAEGHKVVLYGYSAGSFVTYEYLLSRLPYLKVVDFFDKINISQEEKDFVAKHPMKDTCMAALSDSKLATISVTGHIIPNINKEMFKKNYMLLNASTDRVCAPPDTVRGVVNFASPLVLFYSDIADPNFELTYYNKLMYKYVIEKDLFFLTVNYREDPMGFPTTRNLTIEELESKANIDIEPHQGFIYDWSNVSSKRTFMGAHTSYWATRKTFSKAIVTAYECGYRHQYDKEFQKKALKKYPTFKHAITETLQKLP